MNEYSDKVIQEKFGYAPSLRLYVDEDSTYNYFTRVDKAEFLSQLDSMSMHSLKEEAFIYVPKIGVAFEFGNDETPTKITLNNDVFETLVKEFDVLELYHYHPYHSDPSPLQRLASVDDIHSFFSASFTGLELNPRSSITGHHVASHYETSYGIHNSYILTLDKLEYKENYIPVLTKYAVEFISSDIINYGRVNSNSSFSTPYSYTSTIDSTISIPIDINLNGGKSDFFYINFTPLFDKE